MRAVTGIDRIGESSPLFRPGQILDSVRAADGSAVDLSFAFPEAWIVAGGQNLDVRDVQTSDSAFVLATELPGGKKLEQLPDDFFLKVLFAPEGKYGAYGAVDDRKVLSSELVTASGGVVKQTYRRIALKFAAIRSDRTDYTNTSLPR